MLPVLLVLLTLGTWQAFIRLPAKLALIESQLAQRDNPLMILDPAQTYTHGQPFLMEGRFLPDHALFVRSGTHEGRGGGWMVAPFMPGYSDADNQLVWVILGWIPLSLQDDLTSLVPTDTMTFEAYIQYMPTSSRRGFTIHNDEHNGIWVKMDPAAFSRSLALDDSRTAAFWLHWRDPNLPGRWPLALPPDHGLTNNHLGYAITWYGLALALVVMLVMLSRRSQNT